MKIDTFNNKIEEQSNIIKDIKYNLGMSGNGVLNITEQGLYDVKDYSQVESEVSVSFNSIEKIESIALNEISSGEFVYNSPFLLNVGNISDSTTNYHFKSVAFSENYIMTLAFDPSTNGDNSYGNLCAYISHYDNNILLSCTKTLLYENVRLSSYGICAEALNESTACIFFHTTSNQNITAILVKRSDSSLTITDEEAISGGYPKNCIVLENNKLFFFYDNIFYRCMSCKIIDCSNDTITTTTSHITEQYSDNNSSQHWSIKFSNTQIAVLWTVSGNLYLAFCTINNNNVTTSYVTVSVSSGYNWNYLSGVKVNDNTIIISTTYRVYDMPNPCTWRIAVITLNNFSSITSVTETLLESKLWYQYNSPCDSYNDEIYSFAIKNNEVILYKIMIEGEAISYDPISIMKMENITPGGIESDFEQVLGLTKAPNGLLATCSNGNDVYVFYFKNKNMAINTIDCFNGIALSGGKAGDKIKIAIASTEV